MKERACLLVTVMLLVGFGTSARAAMPVGCGTPNTASGLSEITANPNAMAFPVAQGATATQTLGINEVGLSTDKWSAAPTVPWLSVNPTQADMPQNGQSSTQVTANTAGLAPGEYNGSIQITPSRVCSGNTTAGVTLTVPVSLLVTASGSVTISLSPSTLSLAAGSSLTVNVNVTRTNYTGSLELQVGAMPEGVTFSSVSPGTSNSGRVIFSAASNAPARSNFGVTIRTSGQNIADATATLSLSVVMSTNPLPNEGGTVNAASFAAATAVSPGIVSLFGLNLAPGTTVATNVPLPTTLNGVTVRMNNIAAPLFFVSSGQINFQIPWELLGLSQASLTVTVNGVVSSPVLVPLAAASPGIFTINQSGTGQGAIQIANTAIFAAPGGSIPGAQSQPASRGQFLTIYCTGLGDVTNRPANGQIAPSATLAEAKVKPIVTLGGVDAPVSFAGLTPGFVALSQINIQIPANAPIGNAVELIVRVGNVSSNKVTVAIQ